MSQHLTRKNSLEAKRETMNRRQVRNAKYAIL